MTSAELWIDFTSFICMISSATEQIVGAYRPIKESKNQSLALTLSYFPHFPQHPLTSSQILPLTSMLVYHAGLPLLDLIPWILI